MAILNKNNIMTLIAFLIFSPATLSATFDLADINGCMNAARNAKANTDFLKIEELLFRQSVIYEIEVRDPDGVVWELSCKAEGGGTIFSITRETKSASDPFFTEGGNVSEDAALAKALEKFPGKLVETEYERRIPGNSLYEFDIINSFGQITRVEIDAVSGEIIEAVIEEWEIHWEESH